MKKLSILALTIITLFTASAFMPASEKLTSRTGHIWFFSSAPLENIEAHNYQASSALNTKTGEMAYSVLIKGFEFQKALMQTHFNENYMESEKYPNSTFKGKILDISKVNFNKKGTYPVNVEGDLTIHGVTKSIKADGTITVADGSVNAKSKFPVRLKDYNIEIPKLVKEKIAEVVDVNVDVNYSAK